MQYPKSLARTFSVGPEKAPGIILRDALESVAIRAENLGLSERTVKGAYRAPAKSVLRYLDGGAALANLSVDAIQGMVRRCLAENLSPVTVKMNYLRVMRLAFSLAGYEDDENPVLETVASMRHALRCGRKPVEFLTLEEVHDTLRKVRTYRSPSGKRLRCQPRDHAIFQLVAFRGPRPGELERIDIARDVRISSRQLTVHSKVVTLPRVIHLSEVLTQGMITMVAARTEGPLLPGGMHMLNAMCERWKKRISEPRLNLRMLRRSFATSLASAGVSQAGVSHALGHVPGSPHTGRYVGVVQRELRAALSSLEHPGPPPSWSSPPSDEQATA